MRGRGMVYYNKNGELKTPHFVGGPAYCFLPTTGRMGLFAPLPFSLLLLFSFLLFSFLLFSFLLFSFLLFSFLLFSFLLFSFLLLYLFIAFLSLRRVSCIIRSHFSLSLFRTMFGHRKPLF